MIYPFYLTPAQEGYILTLKKTFQIEDAAGQLRKYEPLFYQIYLHADCLVCSPDPPDRISLKSRKTGVTMDSQMDRLLTGMKYPGTYPFSSITKEVGKTPLEWLQILIDNSTIKERTDFRHIKRRMDLTSRVILTDNGSEFFEVPGNNPNVFRSFGTISALNDEFGRCKYPVQLYQATRGSLVGFFCEYRKKKMWQHDILTTNPDDTGHYFYELVDNVEGGVLSGFKIYHQEMFPPYCFNPELEVYPSKEENIGNYDICQLDEEFYYYYVEGNEKKMTELCNKAWMAGMWEHWHPEVEAELEHEKYRGLWDEDRGIIPINWWFPLQLREQDRLLVRLIFMREYQSSRESATGSLIPQHIADRVCVLPVVTRSPGLWAYETEGIDEYSYYFGLDFGGTAHKCALSIGKLTSPKMIDIVLVQMIDKIDTPGQYKLLKMYERKFPTVQGIGIDTTGAGQGLGDLCSIDGALSTRPYLFVMNSKKVRVGPIEMAIPSSPLWSEGQPVATNLKFACADHFRLLCWFNNVRLMNDPVIKRDIQIPDETTLKSVVDPKTKSHADIFSSAMITCYLPYFTKRMDLPSTGTRKERTDPGIVRMPIKKQAEQIVRKQGYPLVDRGKRRRR